MKKKTPDFTVLNHTADLGIRAHGTDLRDLFENAARAMLQTMVRIRPGGKAATIRLSLDGQDLADLMVRWLGEILYLIAGEDKVVLDVEIDSITPSHLRASVEYVPFDPELHEIQCEIKAVTYHQIDVSRKNGLWQATVVFDL